MTGLPGGVFFVGVRGLAGAWRVLGGFLAGSWRVLGGRKYAPENGFRGVGGFGFRKGWEGFGFRGVEGLAFERGGGGWMLGYGWGWACLGLDARAFGAGRGLLPFLLPFGAFR
mgnify:CR=1 FL=1